MRFSKRKWTLILLVLFCFSLILFQRFDPDYNKVNSVFHLNFNDSNLVSEEISFENRATKTYFVRQNNLLNDYRFLFSYYRVDKCITENIILLIKSAIVNQENREVLRKYFTYFKYNVNISFTWYFFIGTEHPNNRKFEDSIKNDMKNNDDLIQVNFVDSYLNNTLKLMSEIFWMKLHLCSTSIVQQRYLFIDDDVYINFKNIDQLLSPVFDELAIFGHKNENASPYRWKWSKWYVSWDQYPINSYPPYISGSTIVINEKALKKISLIIPYVKYFPFDDVYLGFVSEVIGVRVVNDNRILPDYKCGIFCYENAAESIAIHVPNSLFKLDELYRNNAKKDVFYFYIFIYFQLATYNYD